ncbi:MAG: TetR/AcrR family transcriptional regulator [Myxococcota bacterium]
MSRPTNADAAATRAKVLEATLRLLDEEGAPPSSRAVARAAGVSVAVVHHYYGNKKGLMDACIDTMYDGIAQRAGAFAGRLHDVRERRSALKDTIREGYRYARRHRAVLRLLLVEVATEGGLDPARKRLTAGPFLASASAALGSELGLSPPEVRLRIQTIVSTLARYATSSLEDLQHITGLSDEEEIHRAIEAHLVQLALGLATAKR